MASGLSGKGHLEDDKFGAIIYRKGIRSDQQGPSNPQNGFGGAIAWVLMVDSTVQQC